MIAVAHLAYGVIAALALAGLVVFALIVFGAVREAWRLSSTRSIDRQMADLDRARRVTGQVSK